jgi:hypothetical protein
MESTVMVSPTAGNAAVTSGVRRWFDLTGAAEYACVPVKSVRAAIAAGKVPRARIGRKFVVNVRDLDSWLLGELIRED